MRRLHSLSVSFAVLSAFLVLTSREARADGTPSQPPNQPPKGTPTSTTTTTSAEPPSTLPADADRVKRKHDDDELKNISLTANPLGLLIGRYSIQGEFLPAPHHAITLNPFFAHVPLTVNGIDLGSLNGFGGELGYKFYSSSNGPAGFYVAPSFLFGSYSQSDTVGLNGTTVAGHSFTSIGGAIDIGGQAVVGPGVVIGGGFGLQYTKTSESITGDLNWSSNAVAGGGLRPRFLLSVGYAF